MKCRTNIYAAHAHLPQGRQGGGLPRGGPERQRVRTQRVGHSQQVDCMYAGCRHVHDILDLFTTKIEYLFDLDICYSFLDHEAGRLHQSR